jgi:hypothetical protein
VSKIIEYYTIVRSARRITLPPSFKIGDPVKIRIERIVDENKQKEISGDN